MNEDGDEVVGPDLQRLGSVVQQRTDKVWRHFLVAQARVQAVARRREATTQKIFLVGETAVVDADRR